jgi:hypothetical protein
MSSHLGRSETPSSKGDGKVKGPGEDVHGRAKKIGKGGYSVPCCSHLPFDFLYSIIQDTPDSGEYSGYQPSGMGPSRPDPHSCPKEGPNGSR